MIKQFLLFILSLSCITLTLAKANVLQCNSNDLIALNDFKSSIQIDFSKRLGKWIGNQCCQWDGIICDNTTGRVTEVNLPAFIQTFELFYYANMSGFLSPSITLLSSLQVLDLGGQVNISGTIPKSIGSKLPHLRKLVLFGNKITGPIPDSILELTKLEILDLHSNSLSGTILENIGVLKSLTYLDLSDTKLEGIIPTSMGNLSSLEFLGLSRNRLSGTIPSSLGNLSQLTELHIDGNMLSGTIPKSLGNLKALKEFIASYNMIKDPLPQEMSTLGNMFRLDLSFNHLNLDTIPTWLAGLPNLTEISLAGCGLKSLDAFENRTDINTMEFSSNNLTGSIPTWIGKFKTLYTLKLSRNAFVSNIPSTGQLYTLDISYNLLESTLPESLASEQHLARLHLQNNHFIGKIPPSYGQLSNLQELDLSNNFLVGKIPVDGKLDKFSASSYLGNKGLCGTPLPPCTNEKIIITKEKPAITFQGEGYLKTEIVWNDTVKSAGGTFSCGTVQIFSANFVAKNITFKNSAPPLAPGDVGGQAVAVRVGGDMVAFWGCGFYGAHD